ncbi:SDR family NAD(P)-dependent oxidoreductase [Methylocella sp.]|uniref:SDR family NAD(P)-dependent oxidoreductase n=1 Tax=Methylocella sp. TaxID=1978226 RepID=UPI003783B835
MGRLAGKTALVTGASKGIGAAIARRFAEEGAAVVVNYASSREGAERVVADIKAKGGKAVAAQGDVGKAADVEKIFAQAKAAFGKVDILVNNAGVYKFAPLEEVEEAELRRQFDINVFGLILATKAAAAQFGDGGVVLNVSSAITELEPPQSTIYTATKAAVDAVTHVLSKELGPRGIRVNALNPGVVETEGTRTAGVIGSEFETGAVAQTPLGRVGQPSEIADVALFLVSDDARWVTGETLLASGGLR